LVDEAGGVLAAGCELLAHPAAPTAIAAAITTASNDSIAALLLDIYATSFHQDSQHLLRFYSLPPLFT
jgi:hypothetical protein